MWRIKRNTLETLPTRTTNPNKKIEEAEKPAYAGVTSCHYRKCRIHQHRVAADADTASSKMMMMMRKSLKHEINTTPKESN